MKLNAQGRRTLGLQTSRVIKSNIQITVVELSSKLVR